jgi:predicted DNA-binding protein (MmcQ/YjbR family)
MNIESLRLYCLSKNRAEETFPFDSDTLVFKVLGKAFLLTSLEGRPFAFNLKCDPEKALALREEYACVQPGYHMNKKHWNTILPDATVSDKMLQSWIDDSYNLVADKLPKKAKEKLAKKR